MTTTQQATGRKFVWWERFHHADGEQVLLGEIRDGGESKGYRVGFSNHEPAFGPVVTWGHGDHVDYWVTCEPGGTAEQCTCGDWKFRGRRNRKPCKHMGATTALIRAGVFKM